MLSRLGRVALALTFLQTAGCSGDAVSESAAPPTSPAPQLGKPSPDFSGEFVNGIGPEERAWLESQRRRTKTTTSRIYVDEVTYAPISAELILRKFGGRSGAEIALDQPQAHRIQFLNGGAARVAIWDGYRYLPNVFTSVESRQGARICLARTRGWTGGCLTLTTNGRDFRCGYLWNNGASGETGCRVAPVRAG